MRVVGIRLVVKSFRRQELPAWRLPSGGMIQSTFLNLRRNVWREDLPAQSFALFPQQASFSRYSNYFLSQIWQKPLFCLFLSLLIVSDYSLDQFLVFILPFWLHIPTGLKGQPDSFSFSPHISCFCCYVLEQCQAEVAPFCLMIFSNLSCLRLIHLRKEGLSYPRTFSKHLFIWKYLIWVATKFIESQFFNWTTTISFVIMSSRGAYYPT